MNVHKIVSRTPLQQIAVAAGQLGRPAAAAQLAIQTGSVNPDYSQLAARLAKTESQTPSINLESLRADNDKIAGHR